MRSDIFRKPSFLPWCCVIGLLISNAVILWKHLELRNRPAARAATSPRAIGELFSSQLQTDAGRAVLLREVKAQYVVLFLFTHSDCPPCLDELPELDRINRVRNDIQVFGLMSHASPEEAAQIRENFNINFPLLLDLSGHHLQSLGPPKTPWKVVISMRSQQVVYEDPPSLTDVEREAFISRVTHLGSL